VSRSAPIIAVCYRFESKAAPYLDALRDAGCDPVGITPANAPESLKHFEGLVLTGGTDLSPELYGEAPHPQTQPPDPERDEMDLQLLRDALSRNLPVLAICRGMQLFNVAHGGTLIQHIEGHAIRGAGPAEPVHEVVILPETRLAAILGQTAQVNSRHHQAVGRVGSGLAVSAMAPDGIVEGLERPDQRFALAVQWHPEDQIRQSSQQRGLFQDFARACGERGAPTQGSSDWRG
jgi:putative glutamine amidotransferase